MFRKTIMSFALLYAASLLTAPITARADRNDSVSGAGIVINSMGETKFSFNAMVMEDGTAMGHALFVYGGGADGRIEVDINGVDFTNSGWIVISGTWTSELYGTLPVFFSVLPSVYSGRNEDFVGDPYREALEGWSADDAAGPVVRGSIRVYRE
jgi:hypothetical protein